MSDELNDDRREQARVVALTDPVRWVLKEVLYIAGEATLAQMSKCLPIEARGGLARQLQMMEDAGLAEFVGGEGRNRRWRGIPAPIYWGWPPDLQERDPERYLALAAMELAIEQNNERRRRDFAAQLRSGQWSDTWSEAASKMSFSAEMTPNEVEALAREILGLVHAHKAQAAERVRAGDNDQREVVSITVDMLPFHIRGYRAGVGWEGESASDDDD